MNIEKIEENKLPFTPGGSDPWDVIPIQSQLDQDAIDDGETEPFDWMDLRRMPDEFDALIDADETVLTAAGAKLVLVYPMDVAAVRELSAPNGTSFTRGELMRAIEETYRHIYALEEQTQSAPTPETVASSAVINRPASDGLFGIWGHVLDDLGVSAIEVHKVDGVIWLDPVMES